MGEYVKLMINLYFMDLTIHLKHMIFFYLKKNDLHLSSKLPIWTSDDLNFAIFDFLDMWSIL